MDSSFALSSAFTPFHKSKKNPLFHSKPPFSLSSKTHLKPYSRLSISANFSSNSNMSSSDRENPFAKTLQSVGKTLILTVAASLITSKIKEMPVKAEPLTPTVEEQKVDDLSEIESGSQEKTPLAHLMDSYPEFAENLRKLQEKLEVGEAKEALKIVGKLIEAQPDEIEWKFIKARLLSEMGKLRKSRETFEEILALNPLSFEALYENALLMDRCGEGNDVFVRLEKALRIAIDDNKPKEARDVRLIIAQFQFLRDNVDEALKSYEELRKEDPEDYMPYFCKGVVYSSVDRIDEAKEEFAKYRALSSEDFNFDEYLRTPLSRMKPFGTDSKS